jgi:hypothetical protein
LEIVYDANDGTVTQDLPLSFNPRYRHYGLRFVERKTYDSMMLDMTSHDPFATLGGDL